MAYNNQQKKIAYRVVDFAVMADLGKLKIDEKKDKYRDLTWELKKKKQWDMKVTIIPIVIGVFGTVTKKFSKGLEIRRASGDHPNNSIIDNSQNTEKSPTYLMRLAVTQTTVKDHQLTLI